MPRVYCDRMANLTRALLTVGTPFECKLQAMHIQQQQAFHSSQPSNLIFQQINSFQFWHNTSKQQHNVPFQLRFIVPGFPKANSSECNKEISSSLPWCQLNQLIVIMNSSCIIYPFIYSDTQSQSQFRQSHPINFTSTGNVLPKSLL